jgi:hypothetical protein
MDENMDGIDMPHKRDLVLSVVNVVMNLQVPYNEANFLDQMTY